MTKIIGGLLVASLLSGPTSDPLDKHANTDEFHANRPAIEARDTQKRESDSKEKMDQLKIEELMGHIEEKNRSLKSLLKEITKVIGKIQTMMDLRAYTKTPLDERQISSFSSFSGLYTEKAGTLQETLKKIEDQKDLPTTKKELLHIQADYSTIINELKSLSDTQSDAIFTMRSIIDSGNMTLQVL